MGQKKSPAEAGLLRKKLFSLFDFVAFNQVAGKRCTDADRRVRTYNDTGKHGKSKAFDNLSTEDEEDNQYANRCKRRNHGTAKCAIQGIVDYRFHASFFGFVKVLTNTVHYYHRVVDRVTNYGKDRRNERLVNFKSEWQHPVEERKESKYD